MSALNIINESLFFRRFSDMRVRNKIFIGFTIITIVFIVPIFLSNQQSQKLAETDDEIVNYYTELMTNSLTAESLLRNQMSIVKTHALTISDKSSSFTLSSSSLENILNIIYNKTLDDYLNDTIVEIQLQQKSWKQDTFDKYFSLPSNYLLNQFYNLSQIIETNTNKLLTSLITYKLTNNNSYSTQFDSILTSTNSIVSELGSKINSNLSPSIKTRSEYISEFAGFNTTYNTWSSQLNVAKQTEENVTEWLINSPMINLAIPNEMKNLKIQILSDSSDVSTFLNSVDARVTRIVEKVQVIIRYSQGKMTKLSEESRNEISTVFLINSISILAGISLAVVITLLLSQSISKPLDELKLVSNQIAEGDMSKQLNIKAKNSKNEIHSIFLAFNKMIVFLRETVSRIAKISQNLAETSEELSSSAEEINASSEEISSISQVFARGAINQMDQFRSINKSQKNLNAKFSQNFEEVSNSTDNIKKIASQVNMLALNASIEAARAGDYGRGFSVVADNIRNLSEFTNESVTKVNNSLNDLSVNISKSIDEMDSSIDEAITIAEKTASGSEQISASTEEQAATMEEMSGIAQELTRMAHVLNESIIKFKFFE